MPLSSIKFTNASSYQIGNKTQFSEKELATVYYLRDIEKADIAKIFGNQRNSMPNSCKNVYHNVVHKKLRSCPNSADKYKALYLGRAFNCRRYVRIWCYRISSHFLLTNFSRIQ